MVAGHGLVGVDEDGQAEAAASDVAGREGKASGKLLLDTEFKFVGQWRNEVGIEAVEALGAENLRAADCGSGSTRGRKNV